MFPLTPFLVEHVSAEFVRTRRASASRERLGPPGGLTPIVAAVAGAFARWAAAVEGWARGNGTSSDVPLQHHASAR